MHRLRMNANKTVRPAGGCSAPQRGREKADRWQSGGGQQEGRNAFLTPVSAKRSRARHGISCGDPIKGDVHCLVYH